MKKSDYQRYLDAFESLKNEGDIIDIESESMAKLATNLAYYRRHNPHVVLRAHNIDGVFKVVCLRGVEPKLKKGDHAVWLKSHSRSSEVFKIDTDKSGKMGMRPASKKEIEQGFRDD